MVGDVERGGKGVVGDWVIAGIVERGEVKAVGEGNDLRAKVVVGLWKNIEDRKQVNDGREKVTNGEEEGEVCSKYA